MRYYGGSAGRGRESRSGANPQGGIRMSGTRAPGWPGGLTANVAALVRERFGTPCYVYDRVALEAAARQALAVPAPYGLTLRYAMKANPSHGILALFRDLGLHVDASSDFEVERALRAGFPSERVQLTSQMPSRRLAEHVRRGVLFNACSLHQLEEFGRVAPGGEVSVRINPGLGSGSTKRTNTGGPASSFGIWHAYLDEVTAAAARHRLRITRLHAHIGSGTDPEIWKRVARMTLDIAARFPDVAIVNLGGGFKVGRMPEEPSVDLADVGAHVRLELEGFRERDGRALHLEIEPGTFLVANAGAIVASCIDVLAEGREAAAVVFVGPCCEAGDILTPAPGDPEALAPRWVPRPQIGDLVVIGGAGAYCAAMATINYNSYPQAPEVMLEPDGTLRLLRKRQAPEQVWQNEV